MKNLEEILEIASLERKEGLVERESQQRNVWFTIKKILLICLFTIIGIMAIILSWTILIILIRNTIIQVYLNFIMILVLPGLLWVAVFTYTAKRPLRIRRNLRILSAIGFSIAAALIYIFVSPFLFLGLLTH